MSIIFHLSKITLYPFRFPFIVMEYTLPKSWAEIPLSQFVDIENVVLNDKRNDLHKWNKIISILLLKDVKEVEAMPFVKVNDMIGSLDWVNHVPTQRKAEFIFKGITYRFQYDIFNASTGQYAMFKDAMSQEGRFKFAEAMAILSVPVGEQFDADKVKERAEEFWNGLGCDVIYPYCGFFLSLYTALLQNMPSYLRQKNRRIRRHLKSLMAQGMDL